MIRAPHPAISRSATWLLGLLRVYQKSPDMSELSVRTDELDCLSHCISAWAGSSRLLRPGKTYLLQSSAGLFTLPYGHTRDLPTVIVGRRACVRSSFAVEFQEMHR
jgi:hypothetical protein